MTGRWAPAFGAHVESGGVAVRLCAPGASRVRVRVEGGAAHALVAEDDGVFSGWIDGPAHGDRYTLQLDAHPEWPDPWSRWQPDGVHRPSMLIDPPVIVSSPAMEFSNVDLPQPDGPTNTKKPPLSISRSMPFSTDTLPNDFSRLRISRKAMPYPFTAPAIRPRTK